MTAGKFVSIITECGEEFRVRVCDVCGLEWRGADTTAETACPKCEAARRKDAIIALAGMAHNGYEEDVGYYLESIGYAQCLYCRESDLDFADQFYPLEEMTPVSDASLGCGMLCPYCASDKANLAGSVLPK